MTTAAYATSGSRVLDRRDERARLGAFAALKRAVADYMAYRNAVWELSGLDIRQREDLGIAGRDIRDVAREAVYGN